MPIQVNASFRMVSKFAHEREFMLQTVGSIHAGPKSTRTYNPGLVGLRFKWTVDQQANARFFRK
jgi:hypothetical protein